jgi:hypothetical protein
VRANCDPVAEPGDDGHAAGGQPPREGPRHLHAVVAGACAANDRHDGARGELSQPACAGAHLEHLRRAHPIELRGVFVGVPADRLHVGQRLVTGLSFEAGVACAKLRASPAGERVEQLAVGKRQQLEQSLMVSRAVVEWPAQLAEQPAASQA